MRFLSIFGSHWWRWRQRVERDFVGMRARLAEMSCRDTRIEIKANEAIDKTVAVAADTSVMLKKSADAVTRVAIDRQTIKGLAERQQWQADELNKVYDYLGKIDAYLNDVQGTTYRQSVPHPLTTVPDAT